MPAVKTDKERKSGTIKQTRKPDKTNSPSTIFTDRRFPDFILKSKASEESDIFEDSEDARIAEEAYAEYLRSGKISYSLQEVRSALGL